MLLPSSGNSILTITYSFDILSDMVAERGSFIQSLDLRGKQVRSLGFSISQLENKATQREPSTKEQERLDLQKKQRVTLTRRRFTTLGLGTIGAAALGGVGVYEVTQSESHPKADILPLEKLTTIIENLPESPVKAILTKRILPRFTSEEPITNHRGTFTYVTEPATVTEEVNEGSDQTEGLARLNKNYPESDNVSPIQDQPVNYIIPGFMTDADIEQQLGSDTAPFTIYVTTDETFPRSLHSSIYIAKADAKGLNEIEKKQLNAAVEMTYIKEACSLALEDLYAEAMYNEMERAGLPTHMDVVNQQGSTEAADIVHVGVMTMMHYGGQTTLFIDGGGLLLAVDAVKDAEVLSRFDPTHPIFELVSLLRQRPLGNTNDEILTNTAQLCREYADTLKNFGVLGDVTKFP